MNAAQRSSEDAILAHPLTQGDFRAMSDSAHAFWQMPLRPTCHESAGVSAIYKSQGLIEFRCNSCTTLIGCVAVAETCDASPG